MRKSLYIFGLLFLFFISCDKDEDSEYPIINLSSPSEMSEFDVLELVSVKASISDNKNIKSVSVSLFNSTTRIQAVGPDVFYPNATSYELDHQYHISDSLLNSGEYYFKITASDGENEISSYRNININGIPKRKLSVIAAISVGGGTKLVEVESAGRISDLSTVNIETNKIAINSYSQKMWMVPSFDSEIAIYDILNDRLNNIFTPNANGFSPFFSDFKFYNQRAYVAKRDGDMDAYSDNLGDVFSYFSNQDEYVSNFLVGSQYALLVEEHVSTLTNRITTINSNSGGLIHSFTPNRTPIGFGFKTDDEAYYFAQEGNVFYAYDLDPRTGFNSKIYERNGDFIAQVIQMDSENFILMNDSALYQFNIRSSLFDLISSGTPIGGADYDIVNNQIVFGAGSVLNVFDLTSRAIVDSYSLSGPINAVAVRYNK